MTQQSPKRIKLTSESLAHCLIAFGILAILVTTILYLTKTTELNITASIDPSIFSSYGAFVGGLVGSLFALVGVLLLLSSLREQKQAFQRQQIDNRLIQLINIARENSEKISIRKRNGKRVFITLVRELYESYSVAKGLSHELAVDERQLPNIAYLAFFYGSVGETSKEILRKRLAGLLTSESIDRLLKAYERRRAHIEKNGFPYPIFDGHQSRLGHYYRHLFQAVSYINEQPAEIIKYREKYRYVKMLRAQLSTQEQLLLFWNSISELGLDWERAEHLKDPNSKLITKYNLIKNIPDGFSKHLKLRDYYPDIKYEGQTEMPVGREKIQDQYR